MTLLEPSKRAACYMRCSTTRQDLESQRAKLEAWAASKGHESTWFEDAAISGRKTDRPGLNDLLAGVDAGRFDLVAVVELSRLGRSMGHIHATIEKLATKNVKVVLVNSGTTLDNATLEGHALIGALALAADIEWMLISERNARGRAKIKADGIRVGRKEKPVSLQAIKALREKGLGLRGIAKELGVSAPTIMRHLRKEDGHLPNVTQSKGNSAGSANNPVENETALHGVEF